MAMLKDPRFLEKERKEGKLDNQSRRLRKAVIS